MKKFAIILALLVFQTQIICAAATTNSNYNKKPAQKTQPTNTKQIKQTSSTQAKPANNEDFLLKYNINDLEAAPWLNGGKRKI